MGRSDYSGMIVNERLYVSGRIDEFDEAIHRKDQNKIVDILRELEVCEDSIFEVIRGLQLTLLLDKGNKEE